MLINEILLEYLSMKEYDMWGWITPEGNILLPTKDDAASERPVSHTDLVPSRDYTNAFKKGYIRWFIKKNTLYFEVGTVDLSEKIYNLIKIGTRKIEDLAKNPKNFYYFPGPLAQQQSKAKESLTILRYEVDITDFYYRADNIRVILNRMLRQLDGVI